MECHKGFDHCSLILGDILLPFTCCFRTLKFTTFRGNHWLASHGSDWLGSPRKLSIHCLSDGHEVWSAEHRTLSHVFGCLVKGNWVKQAWYWRKNMYWFCINIIWHFHEQYSIQFVFFSDLGDFWRHFLGPMIFGLHLRPAPGLGAVIPRDICETQIPYESELKGLTWSTESSSNIPKLRGVSQCQDWTTPTNCWKNVIFVGKDRFERLQELRHSHVFQAGLKTKILIFKKWQQLNARVVWCTTVPVIHVQVVGICRLHRPAWRCENGPAAAR